VTSGETLETAQQRYYDLYAGTYHRWIAGYLSDVRDEIAALMHASPALHGDVLECAPGSGELTALLSGMASHVTAVDGSRAMLDILRDRALPHVTAVHADLFTWEPDRQWDAAFMANWLSHVPPGKVGSFFDTLSRAVRPGGSVIVLDVTAKEMFVESRRWEECGVPVVERIANGEAFPVVKVFWEPDVLLGHLGRCGWSGEATTIGAELGRGFVYYELWRS